MNMQAEIDTDCLGEIALATPRNQATALECVAETFGFRRLAYVVRTLFFDPNWVCEARVYTNGQVELWDCTDMPYCYASYYEE
jgi:hypothetical protein